MRRLLICFIPPLFMALTACGVRVSYTNGDCEVTVRAYTNSAATIVAADAAEIKEACNE